MINALVKEIELTAIENEIIETIYFGGGTPSLLTQNEIVYLLNAIQKKFIVSPVAEITLEANPDDITVENLFQWKTAGINRLSIGIQSFKEEDLQWMNRAHNLTQAQECIALAKESGFNNFSIDLIYGTPGLTDKEWKTNVDYVINFKLPHIASYALTIEPNTALQKMIVQNKKSNVDTEQQARQFLLLMQWMKDAGYEHYEISNFAMPGYRSRHNSSYWQGKKYFGIGPSAHSYDGVSRKWNVANNALYIQSIKKNIPLYEEEKLTETHKLNEYIMTSLRTMEGIDLKIVEENFSAEERKRIENDIQKYIHQRKIIFKEEKIILTDEGKLFADGIASDLFRII